MNKSDIEFHIEEQRRYSTEETRGMEGKTGYDIENKRILITVYDFMNGSGNYSYLERLIHELDHGRQFMDFEIEFATNDKKDKVIYSGGISYDRSDERNSFVAQSIVARLESGNGYMDEEITKILDQSYQVRALVPINSSIKTISSLQNKGYNVYSALNTNSNIKPVNSCPDESIKGSNAEGNVEFLD